MIYNIFDKGGVMQPFIDNIIQRYPRAAVKYVDKKWDSVTTLSRPFFSPRWLIVIQDINITKKSIHELLGNPYLDLLILTEKFEKLSTVRTLVVDEIVHITDAIKQSVAYNKYLSTLLHKSKNKQAMNAELDAYAMQTQLQQYSVYDVSDEYLERYTYWLIEGKPDFKTVRITNRTDDEQTIVHKILPCLRGNESQYTTLVSLAGKSILNPVIAVAIMQALPRQPRVIASSLPMHFFLTDIAYKRDVINCMYKFRKQPKVLNKHFEKFFDTFFELYKEYQSGRLSLQNKKVWYAENGAKYKIWSEYTFERWFTLITRYSYERMFMFKEGLNRSKDLTSAQQMIKYLDLFALVWKDKCNTR